MSYLATGLKAKADAKAADMQIDSLDMTSRCGTVQARQAQRQ